MLRAAKTYAKYNIFTTKLRCAIGTLLSIV